MLRVMIAQMAADVLHALCGRHVCMHRNRFVVVLLGAAIAHTMASGRAMAQLPGMDDLRCGQQFPSSPGSYPIDCTHSTLFVIGYNMGGGARDCDDLFGAAINEFKKWGWEGVIKTVGLYSQDSCDLDIGDYGATIQDPVSGETINHHAFSAGTQSNHVWVGGTNCGVQPPPNSSDWPDGSKTHCRSHSRATPIEHLSYHFSYLASSFSSSPVDVVAHSMGGLVTQGAHSYFTRQPGLAFRERQPYNRVRYHAVAASGTPFNGIPQGGEVTLNGLPVGLCSGVVFGAPSRRPRLKNETTQCKQLRSGSAFLNNMRLGLAAHADLGQWSVIGSNVNETQTDLPIPFVSAVDHTTNKKYIYDPYLGDFQGLATQVTHVRTNIAGSKMYYDYTEAGCSGFVVRQYRIGGGTFMWPDCWDSDLWKFDGPTFGPTGGPNKNPRG